MTAGTPTVATNPAQATRTRRREKGTGCMLRLERATARRSNGSGSQCLRRLRSTRGDRGAQQLERLHRFVPAEARVGDALAIDELGGIVPAGDELLRPWLEVAFDHHAEDAAAARLELRRHIARNVHLACVELAA